MKGFCDWTTSKILYEKMNEPPNPSQSVTYPNLFITIKFLWNLKIPSSSVIILKFFMKMKSLIDLIFLWLKLKTPSRLITFPKLCINQRTSGPVNTHLTPGTGTYFNAFIHVYNSRAGADNPSGSNVDVNRKSFLLCLQVLKRSLHIFSCFFTCI